MNKTPLQGLYGITSQDILLDNQLLFKKVEQALQGGMGILQYRNKHSSPIQSNDDLIRLKQLCHRYQALFIINDDVNLCKQIQADGVHLGKDDGDITNARKVLGQQPIIGKSCYDQYELALQAQQQGASYIAYGAFFPSSTKPQAPSAAFSLLDKTLKVPVCCIGGITTSNAQPLINHGAQMLAVITDLFNVNNTKTQAEKFSQMF
ncbi:MAG: thiamine phosphate synthase [Gammaproteobacteria bacterium]|nr:thiamine phosphate synthase [Gammaproteobacteria bacterium]